MIALWLLTLGAWASITADGPLTTGETTILRVVAGDRPASGATVRGTLNPGLATESEIAIGIIDTKIEQIGAGQRIFTNPFGHWDAPNRDLLRLPSEAGVVIAGRSLILQFGIG